MKTLPFALIASLLLALAFTRPAGAAQKTGDATATVQKANAKFQELVGKGAPADQLTKELRGLFDIKDLAKRALVDNWDKIKPADRDEIVTLLQKLVEKSYLKSVKANLKYQVEYKGETSDKELTTVKTVVKAERKGRPIDVAVDYVLVKDQTGWHAIDVVTDDVSMLKNYRSQFNRIIAKEGVPGLLAKMRKKMTEE